MIKNTLLVLAATIVLISCEGDKNSQVISTDLIGNPSSASGDEDDENLPFFEFDEKVKEFGTITQGEIVALTFHFKNVGKSNLIISSASASCGCTVPEWPKEPIAPGEKGKIEVSFNSTSKQGLQSKNITLVANTIPNKYVITIKGEVLAPEQ